MDSDDTVPPVEATQFSWNTAMQKIIPFLWCDTQAFLQMKKFDIAELKRAALRN